MRVAAVADLLLTDAANPRSVRFALDRLDEHLGALSSTGSTQPERLLHDLIARFDATDAVALTGGAGDRRTALEAFLDDVSERLEALSDAIRRVHFEVGPPALSLSQLAVTEVREVRS